MTDPQERIDAIWKDGETAKTAGQKLVELLGLKEEPGTKKPIVYRTSRGLYTDIGLARSVLDTLDLLESDF